MIQTFKRGLSFVLVLVMFLGILASVPFTALASTDNTTGDGYYNIISKNDYQLAPGIVESDLVFNNVSSDGGIIIFVTVGAIPIFHVTVGCASSIDLSVKIGRAHV